MAETLGPLGLLPATSAEAQTHSKLAYIESFDLRPILFNYIAEHPDHSPHVHLIARELKRFLSLRLLVRNPKYSEFVPSGIVDEMWHVFILHTKRYREFCENAVGNFIDHTPLDGGKKQGLAKYSGELFSYTKEELTRHYGALPPFVWGISARCDTAAPCLSWPSPHI